MKYIVDRIEGGIVACETLGKHKEQFSLDVLYAGIKEGDHFEFSDGVSVFLEEETEHARNKNIQLLHSLFEE